MPDRRKNKFLKKDRSKGMVTIPFLLVLTIMLFLILSLFALSMTLVHVSVSQYMTYSSARKLFLGGMSMEDQKDQAMDHYPQLRNQFFPPGQWSGGDDWFSIPETLKNDEIASAYQRYISYEQHPEKDMFYGVGIRFSSKVMTFQIPGLVKSANSGPFKANVHSYLGREPSKNECEVEFNEKRGTHICRIFSSNLIPNCDELLINHTGEGDNGC